jgi:hypothetical protein
VSVEVAGAVVVGTAEALKLANTLLAAYFEAVKLARMTEAEVEAAYQAAKKEYQELPLPGEIPDPE